MEWLVIFNPAFSGSGGDWGVKWEKITPLRPSFHTGAKAPGLRLHLTARLKPCPPVGPPRALARAKRARLHLIRANGSYGTWVCGPDARAGTPAPTFIWGSLEGLEIVQ